MYKYIILGIFLIMLTAGCGKESESPEPPPQAQNRVIRKKITDVRPDDIQQAPSDIKPASAENKSEDNKMITKTEKDVIPQPVNVPKPDVQTPGQQTAPVNVPKPDVQTPGQQTAPVNVPKPDVQTPEQKTPPGDIPKPDVQTPEQKKETKEENPAPLPEKPAEDKSNAKPEKPVSGEKEEPPPWMNQVKGASQKTDSPGTPEIQDSKQKDTPQEAGASDSKAVASISILDNLKGPANLKEYNSEGKTDPFIPLFKKEKPVEKKVLEEKADAADKDKKPQIKRIRRERTTPLEKVDLSQLKLVGIIRGARSGDKALIEDGNRKGYIVTKGTFIGIHYGIVEEIKRDRIIVREEEGEDLSGKINYRERELIIQRPPGEEYEL